LINADGSDPFKIIPPTKTAIPSIIPNNDVLSTPFPHFNSKWS